MLVAGVDIGNRYAKAVIIIDGVVKSKAVQAVATGSEEAAKRVFTAALDNIALKLENVDYIVATGYGRSWTVSQKESKSISFAHASKATATCLARGISALMPETRTVLDVGTQNTSILRLDVGGMVRDMQENDKCAAGGGLFFENMAKRLKLDLDEMSNLCQESRNPVYITSMCTIFAEQELISYFHQAPTPPLEDIVGGLYRAISQRIAGLARRVGIEEQVCLVGGVALNKGFHMSLEKELQVPVTVPPQPEYTVAIGAALLAGDLFSSKKTILK